MNKFTVSFLLLFAMQAFAKDMPKELPSSKWNLISIRDNSIDKKLNINMFFDELVDGRGALTGFSGCNTFRGQYFLSRKTRGIPENSIGFSQLASTRKMCMANSASEIEFQFLETLPFVQNYMIHKGKLHLMTVDKKIVMVLKSVEN